MIHFNRKIDNMIKEPRKGKEKCSFSLLRLNTMSEIMHRFKSYFGHGGS